MVLSTIYVHKRLLCFSHISLFALTKIIDGCFHVGHYKVEMFDKIKNAFIQTTSNLGMHVEVKDTDSNVILSRVRSFRRSINLLFVFQETIKLSISTHKSTSTSTHHLIWACALTSSTLTMTQSWAGWTAYTHSISGCQWNNLCIHFLILFCLIGGSFQHLMHPTRLRVRFITCPA